MSVVSGGDGGGGLRYHGGMFRRFRSIFLHGAVRHRSRLFLCACLSVAVLCLAGDIILWIRSYQSWDGWVYASERHADGTTDSWCVASSWGRWHLVCRQHAVTLDAPGCSMFAGRRVWEDRWSYLSCARHVDPRTVGLDSEMMVSVFLGMEYAYTNDALLPAGIYSLSLTFDRYSVPHSYTTCVFAALSLLFGWRLFRRWRRPKTGCCPACGYDLRAHKPGDRCPECGTAVAQSV